MLALILAFIGFVILMSNSYICDIVNLPYMNFICNIVGAAFIGFSIFFVCRFEREKKDIINSFMKNSVSKADYSEQLSILKSMMQEMNNNHIIFDEILKKQNDLNAFNQAQAVSTEKLIASVVEKIKSENDVRLNLLKSCFDEAIVSLNDIKNTEIEIKRVASLNNDKTGNIIEMLKTISNDIPNYGKDILDNSEKKASEMQALISNLLETVQASDKKLDNIKNIPIIVDESISDLVKKFSELLSNIQKSFSDLLEDIGEQEKKQKKEFTKIIKQISETEEHNNDIMTEEIKKLGGQYDQFSAIISSIVQQMSNIAEEDIKIMKGFLND